MEKIRSKRGKVTRSSDFKIKNEVKQHLEAVEAESMPLDLQTSFLSESVRKYLELGRAIPGKKHPRNILFSVILFFFCFALFGFKFTQCKTWIMYEYLMDEI